MNQCHQFTTPCNRRHWLQSTACGFGALAFQAFARRIARAAGSGLDHKPRANRVIFLFMHGGVSQVDSFDPKPALTQYNGKNLHFKGIENLDV